MTKSLDAAGAEELIDRLTERCESYKGQVQAGAATIERLRAERDHSDDVIAKWWWSRRVEADDAWRHEAIARAKARFKAAALAETTRQEEGT